MPRAEDPAGIVTAVARYAQQLRTARQPDDCITVTVREVLDAIGLAQRHELPEATGRAVGDLVRSALKLLGFEPGTRGKHPVTREPNKVLRLPAEPHTAAACASPSSAGIEAVPPTSAELAKLNHTGPIGTARTQRRLAAEKRARSGHTLT